MLYIDPGAGAMLVQALIASVVGAFFAFRASIRNALGKLFGRRPPSE
jgi:hypothetical protein